MTSRMVTDHIKGARVVLRSGGGIVYRERQGQEGAAGVKQSWHGSRGAGVGDGGGDMRRGGTLADAASPLHHCDGAVR
ncbi:hypothetical protein Isolate57596_29890 [Mycobacteroides abscessus subsp. abscessus]|nr:hypothetical protein MABM_04040 [Mycobacteroides abscessus]